MLSPSRRPEFRAAITRGKGARKRATAKMFPRKGDTVNARKWQVLPGRQPSEGVASGCNESRVSIILLYRRVKEVVGTCFKGFWKGRPRRDSTNLGTRKAHGVWLDDTRWSWSISSLFSHRQDSKPNRGRVNARMYSERKISNSEQVDIS